MNSDEKALRKLIDRHLPSPSNEEMAADCDRVLEQLQSRPAREQRARFETFERPFPVWWRSTPMRAAAALVLLAFLSIPLLKVFVFPENVYAIVEKVTGAVYQGSGENERAVAPGERIDPGTPVRTNGDAGAVLKLPGGSRIEMYAKSQLSLEQAEDGLRIRLNNGSVNVTPAKEPAGTLYLQSREVTIPVLGSLFKSAGSLAAPQNPGPRVAFEVATIRPHAAANTDGRGGAGGSNLAPNGCAAVIPTLDPGRLSIPDTTVWTLIALAYPYPNSDLFGACAHLAPLNLISGGPGWIRSDKWDLEATIPESVRLAVGYRLDFGASIPALNPEESSKVQKMMLAFLEERFKFAVRREVKEVSAYTLTLEKDASPKLTVFPWPNSNFGSSLDDPRFKTVWARIPSGRSLAEGATMSGKDVYMADLARLLARRIGRPVVDQTGFTDPFSFILVFNPPTTNNPAWAGLPNVFSALEKQVGLKLQETKTMVETWVIERIDRPSEN